MITASEFQNIVKSFLNAADKNETKQVDQVEFLPRAIIKDVEEKHPDLWVNQRSGLIVKL